MSLVIAALFPHTTKFIGTVAILIAIAIVLVVVWSA